MAKRLIKALENKGIPIIKDPNFYPKDTKIPYIAIGHFDANRIARIYNKIQGGIYIRNKRLFTVINKLLRKFNSNNDIPSYLKLRLIQSPDNSFNVRIINNGYKSSRPYILKNKILTGNKTGLKQLKDKMLDFNKEFNKFAEFLKGTRKKSGSNGSSGVNKCAKALMDKVDFKVTVVHLYYEDDSSSYPMLELSAMPTDKELQTLETLATTYGNRNSKVLSKVQKLIEKFRSENEDSGDFSIVAGLPMCNPFINNYNKLNKLIGTFAIYNTNDILFSDGNGDKLFDNFAKFLE